MTDWPPPAMVLTAGVGSRLAPLSSLRAKATLPVAGIPLISRILARLRAQDVRDAILNLHHRPEDVAACVGDGADIGVRVRYSWEPALLGSAGGVVRALSLIGAERFLIVNGDSLTDLDVRAVWDAHTRSGAAVTLALAPFPASGRYGGVAVSPDGTVTGFRRRGQVHGGSAGGHVWHFIGVQVVERAVFASLPANTPVESVRDVYPALLGDRPGAVRGFVSGATFLDTGTAADYLDTSLELAAAEARRHALVGRGSHVAPTATLVDTLVWDDAAIGDDCRLTRCIVTDGARVPAGSRHESCILMRRQDCPGGARAEISGDVAVVRY